MKREALSLALVAILSLQTAAAAAYPVTIPFGRSWPYSIVIDSARRTAYIDASSGDYPPTGFLLGVLNVTSHSVIGALPLDEVPGPMALDQATGEVFVAGNDSIQVFASTGAVGMLNTSGHQILDMTYDETVSPEVFFTSGRNVFALDPGTSELTRNATLPNGPDSLLLDRANGMLYVSEYLSGQIAVLKASTLATVSTVVLPSCCASELALDPKTQTIYASTGSNLVDMINANTGEFVRSVRVAPSAQNSTGPIAVDNETGRVYVGLAPGGSIVELDGSTGAVLRHFVLQSQVAGLAVDARSGELYATDYHQVTVFDVARSAPDRLLILLGAVVVVAGALVVYSLLRRRDGLVKARAQSGHPGGQDGK